jgi:hypothetical protein
LGLLRFGSAALQHNLDNLQQLGLSKQHVVTALSQNAVLLTYTPEQLARMDAVMQQELGADRQLWIKVLRRTPRAAGCSPATLRQRAQALVAVSNCVGGLAACMALHSTAGGSQLMHHVAWMPVACCQPSTVVLLPLHTYCCTGIWQAGGMHDGRCCTATVCHQHCRVAACAGGVAAVRRG